MKKLFRISFLLTVLCFAVPVFADGDMTTGNKTCTQNCGGLIGEPNPTVITSDDKKQDNSYVLIIYTWVGEQISELFD